MKDDIVEKVSRPTEVTQSELSEEVKTEAAKKKKSPERGSAEGRGEVQSERDITLSSGGSFCGAALPPRLPVSVPSVTNYR